MLYIIVFVNTKILMLTLVINIAELVIQMPRHVLNITALSIIYGNILRHACYLNVVLKYNWKLL